MKIAVTNHAVDRFAERARGVKGFERDSIRTMVRQIVEDGFKENVVRDHPQYKDRRIIPFRSGESILYLSIGKNTTSFPGDVAVIGVLYEHEMTLGQIGIGTTLGDKFPDLKDIPTDNFHPKYRVFVGSGDTIESYSFNEKKEVRELLSKRQVPMSEVAIYRLVEDPGLYK
jgi:hypothetical protein